MTKYAILDATFYLFIYLLVHIRKTQLHVPRQCSQKRYPTLRYYHYVTVLDTNVNRFQALRK